ncbi:sugar fermentation stimulation protein B [Escherichia coli]|uniref:Sugar fermentation stimulation protein B n=1 Tax=Escherichia coli TaxID=562 RepID=A0A376VCV4_ECOLX|nr:sugar fermentation stimulation protein B [Escherichia coli]
MESNFIDWHPADIIAGLRKKGNVNGGGISQKWFEFLNAGERIIAPLAERRDDYCESPGN